MHEEYKRKEEKELIRRFEAFLKNKENHYFNEDSFMQVINYYQSHEKLALAIKACEFARTQCPYSLDIALETTDILLRLDRTDEAIGILDAALRERKEHGEREM